jgi:4-hydroxybenzoyl-CoA thioesterase
MPYRAQIEVQFGDIDQAQIVYYPRFIHYFHVAMEQFFRDVVGIDYARVMNEHRLGHPTVHLEVDFQRPLRYGDIVEIDIVIERVGGTSVAWLYTVHRRGHPEVHATGRVVTVNIDLDSFAKKQIPEWLRSVLEGYRDRWAEAVHQEPLRT